MDLIHAVRGPLAHFVDFLWLAEGYSQPHAAERVLPTGSMGLVLGLANGGFGALASGVRTGPLILDTSKPLSLIGVSFKPGGGSPFFGVPAGELQDQSVPLDALWGRDANTLEERLMAAASHEARFKLLEDTLLSRLMGGAPRDPAVSHAVRVFRGSLTAVSVGAVVERSGLTARRFISSFRDQVGLAPKVFCRLGRFRRVLDVLGPSQQVDWTSVALRCGYFDQAHFIHDFREFAGIKPTEYIRNRTMGPNHVRIPD